MNSIDFCAATASLLVCVIWRLAWSAQAALAARIKRVRQNPEIYRPFRRLVEGFSAGRAALSNSACHWTFSRWQNRVGQKFAQEIFGVESQRSDILSRWHAQVCVWYYNWVDSRQCARSAICCRPGEELQGKYDYTVEFGSTAVGACAYIMLTCTASLKLSQQITPQLTCNICKHMIACPSPASGLSRTSMALLTRSTRERVLHSAYDVLIRLTFCYSMQQQRAKS